MTFGRKRVLRLSGHGENMNVILVDKAAHNIFGDIHAGDQGSHYNSDVVILSVMRGEGTLGNPLYSAGMCIPQVTSVNALYS